MQDITILLSALLSLLLQRSGTMTQDNAALSYLLHCLYRAIAAFETSGLAPLIEDMARQKFWGDILLRVEQEIIGAEMADAIEHPRRQTDPQETGEEPDEWTGEEDTHDCSDCPDFAICNLPQKKVTVQ